FRSVNGVACVHKKNVSITWQPVLGGKTIGKLLRQCHAMLRCKLSSRFVSPPLFLLNSRRFESICPCTQEPLAFSFARSKLSFCKGGKNRSGEHQGLMETAGRKKKKPPTLRDCCVKQSRRGSLNMWRKLASRLRK